MFTLGNFQKKSAILLLTALLVCLLGLAFPASSVFAAAPEQTPPPPVKDKSQSTDRIEKGFKALTRLVQAQGQELELARGVITRLEAQIKTAKENGKDTADLVKKLEDYKKKLGEAQTAYNRAMNLIKTHPGFDEAGKVTDSQKALDTLKEGQKAAGEVQRAVRPALIVLHRRIGEFLRNRLPRR